MVKDSISRKSWRDPSASISLDYAYIASNYWYASWSMMFSTPLIVSVLLTTNIQMSTKTWTIAPFSTITFLNSKSPVCLTSFLLINYSNSSNSVNIGFYCIRLSLSWPSFTSGPPYNYWYHSANIWELDSIPYFFMS